MGDTDGTLIAYSVQGDGTLLSRILENSEKCAFKDLTVGSFLTDVDHDVVLALCSHKKGGVRHNSADIYSLEQDEGLTKYRVVDIFGAIDGHHINVSDINFDGQPDIIITSQGKIGERSTYWHEGTENWWHWKQRSIVNNVKGAHFSLSIDIEPRDGYPDIVVTSDESPLLIKKNKIG